MSRPSPPRLFALVLLLGVGLLPWLAASPPEWRAHDVTRLAAVAMGAAAALGLMLWRPAPGPAASGHGPLVALLIAVALLRGALAPDPEQALREVASLLGLGALAVFLGQWARPEDLARTVAAATAAYAVSMLSIVLVAAGASIGGMAHRMSWIEYFGYSNIRFYNHVQTVVLPLTLGVAALADAPRWRWIGRLGAACGCALLLHSGGRATGLALVIAAILLAAVGWRVGGPLRTFAWRWWREALLAALAGLLLLALVITLQGGWGNLAAGTQWDLARQDSNLERWKLARFALERAAEAPWFGIGPMHLSSLRGMSAAHPHNVWVQIAAEWGLPVLAVVLFALGLTTRRLWRQVMQVGRAGDVQAQRERAAWGMLLLTTALAVAIDGMFSGNFVMPMSQLWIALLAAWMLAWSRAAHPVSLPGAAPARPAAAWFAIGLIVAAQAGLVASITPDLRSWPQHLERTIERYPNQVLNPRFWSHGWFGPPGPRP
jgi:O-antigen ligase